MLADGRALRISFLLLLLSLTTVGCSVVGQSQFIKPTNDLSSKPIKIDHPENKILLIYNHGSQSENVTDPCFPNSTKLAGGLPQVVKNLAGKQMAGKEIVLYVLCTDVKGQIKDKHTTGNLKITRRIKEIKMLIDTFKLVGISSRNIFLAGHSAGAWASLMIEAAAPDRVNSVIAFSPAFSGKKSRRNLQWQGFREEQEDTLLFSRRIDALVYTFPHDPYNSLADMAFLSVIPGIEYHPLEGGEGLLNCYRGHRTVFKSCFKDEQSSVILDFIQRKMIEPDAEQ